MIFDRLRSLPTSGSIVIPRTAGIGATPPLAHPTGRAGILKSFGRRRRTKVVDERTRGEQAPVYGKYASWLLLGMV